MAKVRGGEFQPLQVNQSLYALQLCSRSLLELPLESLAHLPPDLYLVTRLASLNPLQQLSDQLIQ
jgi:hypothetical protein